MLRQLTAGESHGKALVAILEGLPADVPIAAKELAGELERRRHGYGRSGRQRFEADTVEILTGVRHGRTLGSPISVTIANAEWEDKYRELMGVEGETDPTDKLTRPRPGHADLPGVLKYGFDDVRNVLERASARETAARVALGYFCKAFLAELGMHVVSHVVRIGRVSSRSSRVPTPRDLDVVDVSPVRASRPGDRRADGRRDRRRAEVARHARRRVRSARVRMPAGPRLARPGRSQARRAPRTRAHGHPVGERGRGRRRLQERGATRLEGARRDRHARWAPRPHERPRRRHRGRHEHGAGDPDPRRDEAVLHRPQAPRDRRPRDREDRR